MLLRLGQLKKLSQLNIGARARIFVYMTKMEAEAMNEDYLKPEYQDPFFGQKENCIYGKKEAVTNCYECAVPLCNSCGFRFNGHIYCNDCFRSLDIKIK